MKQAWVQPYPRILIPILLALPLLSYLIWIANHRLLFQGFVLTLVGGNAILGLAILRRPWNDAERKLLMLVVGASLLVITGLTWNALFLIYIKTTGYESDIFRKTMHNLHSPIYGASALSKWPWSLILIVFSSAFIVRVICWRDSWIEHRGLAIELLAWFTGFISMFALSDGPERLIATVAHYRTFASDISRFEGLGDVLHTYSQQMQQLSVHNAHYPPGNLLLVMAGSSLGVSWFARSIVICLTLLTFLPIACITSELHLSTYTKHVALALFISSPAVLSLPSVAMTPIPMFLTATALWLTLVAIRRESSLYSAAVGAIMIVYSYFSFTSIVVWGLLISVTVAQMFISKVKPRILLKLGIVAMVSFLLLCWLFYLFTRFNLYESFVKAIEHNRSIMTSGYDSMLRYLYRSTGNLIAWLLGIGFTASVFGILTGSNILRLIRGNNRQAATYSAAVLGVVFLAAFSTLFFLETERIWLFFVPPWMVVAAMTIGEVSEKHRGYLLKSLLIFSILLATGQELIFQPFTW